MRLKTNFLRNIGLGIVLFLAVFGSEAQQQPSVTGFFSDMRYIRDAGDVIGTEVWIVYAGHFYATVQIAEGFPSVPVVVPVEVTGSNVRFEIRRSLFDQDGKPVPDDVTVFNGTVTKRGLSGTVGSLPLNLARRSSYWQ